MDELYVITISGMFLCMMSILNLMVSHDTVVFFLACACSFQRDTRATPVSHKPQVRLEHTLDNLQSTWKFAVLKLFLVGVSELK